MTSSKQANRTYFFGVAPPRLLLLLLTVLAISFPARTSEAVDAGATVACHRIISLSPLIIENIFLLGARACLVGNTFYCQRPRAALDKEKVGLVMETDKGRKLPITRPVTT